MSAFIMLHAVKKTLFFIIVCLSSCSPSENTQEFSLASPSISKFEQAVEDNPRDARAWDTLANIYLKQGRYSQAEEAFYQLTKLDPLNAKAWSDLGDIYRVRKNFKKSLQALQKAVELEPDTAQYHYLLGNLYRQKGEFKKAIESYQKTVELNPHHEMAWWMMAWECSRKKQTQKAMDILTRAAKDDPENEWILLALEEIYTSKNQTEKAIQTLQRALKINPQNIRAWQRLGSIYQQESKNAFREAAQLSEIAVRENPDDEEAWKDFAYAQTLNEDPLSAVVGYQQAIRLNPFDSSLKIDLGEAWIDVAYQKTPVLSPELIQEAHQALNAVMSAPHEFAFFWERISRTFQRSRQWEKAVQAARRSLELNPDNLSLSMFISRQKRGLKEDDEKSCLTQIWKELALIYKKQDWTAQEIDMLEKVVRLTPQDAMAWNQLASAYAVNHQDRKALHARKKALQTLKQAVQREPENFRLWKYLSIMYRQMGNTQKAEYAQKRYEELRAVDEQE